MSVANAVLTEGHLNQSLANAVVRAHRHHIGRGPTKAQAFFHHDIVVVLMHDILTAGEASLAAAGHERLVHRFRGELEQTMRPALVDAAEQLTGCHVQAS